MLLRATLPPALTDGDYINALGDAVDNGYEMRPNYAFEDTDPQEAFVESQNFIVRVGPRLTLGMCWPLTSRSRSTASFTRCKTGARAPRCAADSKDLG